MSVTGEQSTQRPVGVTVSFHHGNVGIGGVMFGLANVPAGDVMLIIMWTTV